ncbi:hypothetical protein PsYK624_048080 [Phanerochaete sordida]|uniref:Uncharacterized protein n=1 Tax=Phanerochaete sordida TaxID=48140 RepID=A0A9P3G733_9APHY|nr:hypothetical protein PsYK624_048080 [Phanerochaete sordida]
MNIRISGSGSTPHTPTRRAEPLPMFNTNTNRYSTDSWNSSNFDANEIEPEWKPEQTRLLQRTLDALPSHLLTPFNGPVPPSNLLDKIARGVADAKGNNWQHSMRATRAKIVELARVRAKESCDNGSGSDTIAEEDSTDDAPLQQTTNIGLKRPLYRQSSMDFMQPAKTNLQDNSNITRLSRRLQKTERILTSPPYSHYALPSSPTRGPPSLMPSTPSSMTLNSGISDVRPSAFRNSVSSMSSESDQPLVVATRRVRRPDTATGPTSLKRAPSFGSSRNSMESVAMSIDFNARQSDATSSDEEEKLRNQNAKRARRKVASPTLESPLASPPPSSNKRQRIAPKTPSKVPTKTTPAVQGSSQSQGRASKPRANLQRNPSILGPELPNPQRTPQSPVATRSHSGASAYPRRPASPAVYHAVPASPYNLTSIPPVTPSGHRSSRRSRQTAPLPRAPLARKISFDSLSPSQGENGGSGEGLGSAFQLH